MDNQNDVKAVEAYALEQLKAYILEFPTITIWKRKVRLENLAKLAQKIADQFQQPDLVDRLEFIMNEYIDDLAWESKNIH